MSVLEISVFELTKLNGIISIIRAVSLYRFRLPYLQLVGGVFSIRREHFQKVNGYSNLYWGWGAEDDDMYLR